MHRLERRAQFVGHSDESVGVDLDEEREARLRQLDVASAAQLCRKEAEHEPKPFGHRRE